MQRKFYCLVMMLLFAQFASAEVKQLKLLNPDGTPASDAKAVAVMALGARVDASLNELPSLIATHSEPAIAAAKNESGTITFDSKAKAIVAQNDAGFVFALPGEKVTTVKLRPWARFEVDFSNAPEGLLSPTRTSVIWQNCFAGNTIRPQPEVDPFSDKPRDLEPAVDWRFDAYVMWCHTKSDTETTMKVPPGEVSVVLSRTGLSAADATTPIPAVLFPPVRTISNSAATFKLPKFGSVSGQVSQLGLPDWNQERDVRYLRATSFETPVATNEFTPVLNSDLNSLVSFYGSGNGTQFRARGFPEVTTTLRIDDRFIFEYIPEGTYSLELGATSGKPQSLKYKKEVEGNPLQFTVTAGQTTSLDDIETFTQNVRKVADGSIVPNKNESPVQQPMTYDPFGAPADASVNDPFASVNATLPPPDPKAVIDEIVKKAEMEIVRALATQVNEIDYQATPLRTVMQELQDTCNIPIRFNSNALASLMVDVEAPVSIYLPSMRLRSALRHILLSVSDEISFTIRDEVLMITSKEDAQAGEAASQDSSVYAESAEQEPKFDAGEKFLQNWNQSATQQSAPQELQSALQAELERSFDKNQKLRKEELDQLRIMLKQAEDWLDNRQTHRAEIVRKRLNELLEQNKLAPVK